VNISAIQAIRHPWLGWLGFKRALDRTSIALDDHDGLLLIFSNEQRPVLSKLGARWYGGEQLSVDEARRLRDEVGELRAHLEHQGVAAWPRDADGPRVAPTAANIEHMIGTCRRLESFLDRAIEWRSPLHLDGD